MKSQDIYLIGQCDVACLELGLDQIPKQTVFNVLRRIVRKPIKYENIFPDKKRALLSNFQVKYVEDIIIKRDTANLGISRKEVIQVISELGQAKFFSSRESLRLTNSGKAADTFEKAWEGGFSSGNDYRTITDFCVTTVSLAHDD